MPWAPRVRREEAADAIARARSWRDVLDALGYAYHGKNIETMRKWSRRWGIAIDHLSDGGGRARTRYTDAELRQAVAASRSWAETLRRLGYCPTGGNWQTLKKRVAGLAISTEHFDPHAAARERGRNRRIPLDRILVVGSTYSRACLKRRLYESGLKRRRCELCGQSELVAGTEDRPHPGSHQRHPQRQPSRESADRLPDEVLRQQVGPAGRGAAGSAQGRTPRA